MATGVKRWGTNIGAIDNSANPPHSVGRGLTTGPDHGPATAGPDGRYANVANPYEAFFGKPRRPLPDAQLGFEKSREDLPDIYIGHNRHLSTVVIRRMKAVDAFWTNELLPWEQKEDADEIEWDELIFNDHMLNRRPEESTSRLLSYTQRQNSASFVSYGIAMYMESGFYKTPRGRRFYAMHLVQIANATVETACFGAAQAVLNAEPYENSWVMTTGRGLDHRQFMNVLQNEVFMWGIFQKMDGGLQKAYDFVARDMTDRGVTPTMTILPEGSAYYLGERPEQSMALYSGKAGKVPPSLGGLGNVRYSRGFHLGEKRKPLDPFFQDRTIGSYYRMTDRCTSGIPADKYNSAMRGIWAWDETHNDWAYHNLDEVLAASGLITADGRLTRLGGRYFGGHKSWFDYVDSVGYTDRIINGITRNRRTLASFMNMAQANPTVRRQDAPAELIRAAREQKYDQPNQPPAPFPNLDEFAGGPNPRPVENMFNFDAPPIEQDEEEEEEEAERPRGEVPNYKGLNNQPLNNVVNTNWQLAEAAHLDRFARGPTKEDMFRRALAVDKVLGNSNTDITAEEFVAMEGKIKSNGNGSPLKMIVKRDGRWEVFVSDVFKTGDVITDEKHQPVIEDLLYKGIIPYQADYLTLSPGYLVPLADLILRSDGIDVNTNLSYTPEDAVDLLNGESDRGVYPRAERMGDNYLMVMKKYGNPVNLHTAAATSGAVRTAGTYLRPPIHETTLDLSRSVGVRVKLSAELKSRFTTDEKAEVSSYLTQASKWIKVDTCMWEDYSEQIMATFTNHVLRARAGASRKHAMMVFKYWITGAAVAYDEMRRNTYREVVGADGPEEKKGTKRRLLEMAGQHELPAYAGSQVEKFSAFMDLSTYYQDFGDKLQELKDEAGANMAQHIGRILQAYNAIPEHQRSPFYMPLDHLINGGQINPNLATAAWVESHTTADISPKTRYLGPKFVNAHIGRAILAEGRAAAMYIETLNEVKHDLAFAERAGDANQDQKVLEQKAKELKGESSFMTVDEVKTARSLIAYVRSFTEDKDQNGEAPDMESALLFAGVASILKVLPITDGRILKWLITNNCHFPLGFILALPHIRFRCGTMVVAHHGADLGATYYGWPDFQLARNANQKMILGHFTIKIKALVLHTQNLNWGRNVYVNGYLGGGGNQYWKPSRSSIERYRSNKLDNCPDIFVIAVPPSWQGSERCLDITGFFDSTVYRSKQMPHYPSYAMYADLWRWTHGKDPLGRSYQSTQAPRFNTICWEGAQCEFEHNGDGSGSYKRWTINKGHIGDRVTTGCSDVRQGRAWYLPPANYTDQSFVMVGV